MQKAEFPEVKERMETRVCCVHNVSRGCAVGSKVDVVDLALEPLKALKMLMDGLAIDGVSGLWMRSLPGPPRMMHLFPFDFAYLDEDLRIIESIELFPNAPFPKFQADVASALILPLRTLASTGTLKGDQLIICSPAELESQLAEIAAQHNPAPGHSSDLSPVPPTETVEIPPTPDLPQTPVLLFGASPVFDQRMPVRTSTVSPGAGFTVSLATTWQITRMPAAIPPQAVDQEAESTAAAEEKDPVLEPKSAPTKLDESPVVWPQLKLEPCSAIEKVQDDEYVLTGDSEKNPTQDSGAMPQSDLSESQLIEAIAAAEAAASPQANSIPEVERIADQRIARSREAWEKTQIKPSHPPVTSPVRTEKKAREPKKDPLGARVIRWLNLEDPPPERRKIIRLRLDGLQAREVHGDPSKTYEMRDICPTGFCLRVRNKWQPGQVVSLIIEKQGAKENDREQRVRVKARVVRCEEDGVGLEFGFPKGTEFQPWKRAKTKRSDETEAAFILRELRLTAALGLLQRLCPGATQEVRHALHDRLSNKRVASAVDITLLAEGALIREGKASKVFAHPDIVMRIIEGGSWIEDGWIRKLWSGLLVSSCSADGQDNSNQPFIDLLAKLTPLHLRILSFVCSKAVEATAAGETAKDFYLDCTSEELMAASDSHSFARIQQTIGHLSTFGLFAETARPSYVTMAEKSKTRLAPTALGLRMWARCNGQRA